MQSCQDYIDIANTQMEAQARSGGESMNRRGTSTAGIYTATMNQGVRPPKLKLLKRLIKYLLSAKWLMLIALILNLLSTLLTLIGPGLSGAAIDAMAGGKGAVDFPTVFKYAGLMVAFYFLSAAIGYGVRLIMINVSRRVVYTLRRDLFNRLTALPVGFFDLHQTGDIISIISYDVDTINASLGSDLLQILTSIVTVLGSLVMMLRICPQLVIVFAVTVPLSFVFARYLTKVVRPLFQKRSILLGELNGYTRNR